jgi:hypothetical protein
MEVIMFTILDKSKGNCLGFKVSGKAKKEDYEMLLPKLDEAISAYGKINLLALLEDFEGWEDLDTARMDFEFGTQQYRQVERCAFVSDKNWHKWMVKIMDPFTRRTQEKFFEPDQLEEAWEWVCGG